MTQDGSYLRAERCVIAVVMACSVLLGCEAPPYAQDGAAVDAPDGAALAELATDLAVDQSTTCGDARVELASDLRNCGACGRACSVVGGVASCVRGSCVIERCDANTADCDGDASNGCEVNLYLRAPACGTCGEVCGARFGRGTCMNGACRITMCFFGYADCDGVAGNGCETSTVSHAMHCGACGHACSAPNASSACEGGACAMMHCNVGFDDCDGDRANGCEHAGSCPGDTFRPSSPGCVVQSYTVPTTGVYRISASGAGGVVGGARMRGNFRLSAGTVLSIVVGERGLRANMERDGSGGGGSFVVQGSTALVIAGGGGGAGSSPMSEGAGGNVGATGNPGGYSRDIWGREGASGAAGGTGGSDGTSRVARGGLGFTSRAFVVGGSCESRGGDGGVSSWSRYEFGGGGGGGGYSGGGAGSSASGGVIGIGISQSGNGGGGASFNGGTEPWNLPAFNTDDGVVTISAR